MKKLLAALAVLGICIVLVLFFLPFLLSSDFFLTKILDRVNQQPGRHLEIGDLDIGWTQGLRCERVVYEDSSRSLRMRLDRLEGNRGLLALLVAPKNLGAFTLIHPVVTLVARPEQTVTDKPKRDQAASPGKDDGKKEENDQIRSNNTDSGPPIWQELTLQVKIQDGEVILTNEKGEQAFPPGKVNLFTSLASGTVEYTLDWQNGDQGRLDAQGQVSLPSDPAHFIDAMALKSTLHVKRFQLAPLLALAARTGNIPSGQGVLDGEMTITGAGRAKLDLLGSLECSDLTLHGGFLGKDHPRIARFVVTIDGGKKEDDRYHLSALKVNGDFGRMQANGEYGQGQGEIRTEGTLYLPFFTRQMPGLLHIDRKSSLSTGELAFTGNLILDDGKKTIQLEASVDHMAGRLQGKPFSWGRAARLVLAGTSTGQDFSIENVDLKTAFASLSGKGTREHFILGGQIDLHKADTQLGTLFALPWHGQGKLDSRFEVRSGKEGGEQINFVLQSKQCGLVYRDRTVLPKAPLLLQGEVNRSRQGGAGNAPIDLHLYMKAWPGTASVNGKGLQLKTTPNKGQFTFQGDIDLARVTRVLRAVGTMSGKVEIGGQMRLNTDGILSGTRVTFNNPQVKGQDLIIQTGGRVFREPQLVLQGKGTAKKAQGPIAVHGLQVVNSRSSWSPRQGGSIVIDLKKKAIQFHELTVSSRIADLDLSQFAIEDLEAYQSSWHGDLKGRVDLQRASAMALPAKKNAQQVRPKGQLHFTLAGNQLEAPHELALHGEIKNLSFERSGNILYTDPLVSLDLKTNGRLDGDALRIQNLTFDSEPLDLRASGKLLRTGQQQLDLQGEHTVHFAALATILDRLSGKKLVLKGDSTETFNLSLPLAHSAWKEKGRLITRLVLDAFSFAGIEAGPVQVPLQLEDGRIKTGMAGVLNKGRLDVKVLLNPGASPPLLTMPPNQKVLTDVHIDRPIADGILSRLHPLFGVLAKPSGRISATAESFFWPLSKKDQNQARFKVIFDTSKIELVSRGVIREVLALLSVKEDKLSLRQSQVTCTCGQGRVRCSPVKVLVADSEMTISGSVGLDKSLDYLLEIPVTEKLIGREGARVLEGTTIEVPIRGTLGKPLFDRSIITDMLASLASQAAKKEIKKQVDKIIPDLFKKLKF